MRTNQERLVLLHRRAGELQKRKERSVIRAWCGASLLCSVCLIALAAVLGGRGHGIAQDGTSAASSLLSESTGGYVLAAVLAFITGVVITAAIMTKKKNKKKNENNNETKNETEESTGGST